MRLFSFTNNASDNVSSSALVVSPGDTVVGVSDFGVVVCPFGINCTREGVVGVGALLLMGLRVGNEDHAFAVVEIAGATVDTERTPPFDGCRGAGNEGKSSRWLVREGRAGKSSFTFGGFVDNVIVANDSKSCKGCRGFAVVGVLVMETPEVDRGDWVVVVEVTWLDGTTGAITAFLAVARPDAIEADVDVGEDGVVGITEDSSSDDAVVESLRKRLRIPPKKLDFLVVGTGVVVV